MFNHHCDILLLLFQEISKVILPGFENGKHFWNNLFMLTNSHNDLLHTVSDKFLNGSIPDREKLSSWLDM